MSLRPARPERHATVPGRRADISMRIAFVQSSRETFHGAGVRVRIGSGAENDLSLTGAGVVARHLAIVEDRRGWVMEVLPGAPHVYVNARPVRERALLRRGDQLNVGGHKLLLLPDDESMPDTLDAPDEKMAQESPPPGSTGLRAVSGALSGKLLVIDDKLELGGRGLALPGVAGSCAIRVRGKHLLLDTHDSGVLVNGLARKHARLLAGDQLTLGEHRFVVEAPEPRDNMIPAVEEMPITPPPLQEPRASRAEFGWLLGTAALLAAIIALLLWWRR